MGGVQPRAWQVGGQVCFHDHRAACLQPGTRMGVVTPSLPEFPQHCVRDPKIAAGRCSDLRGLRRPVRWNSDHKAGPEGDVVDEAC